MQAIVVAGMAKGVGKTTLACSVISNLPGRVGAIKAAVHDDITQLTITAEESGAAGADTDTARFLAAGAVSAVLIKSSPIDLANGLQEAKALIGEVDYLVVEGNHVLKHLVPALTLFVRTVSVPGKPSAAMAEQEADILVEAKDVLRPESVAESLVFTKKSTRITCHKAHLVADALGIPLRSVGRLLDAQGIKVTQCKLGLF
jgi:molybdopterin-guanine dinucleotide biosynthesis protein